MSVVALDTRRFTVDVLAVCQGRPNARKGFFFLRRDDASVLCPHVWNGSTVRQSSYPPRKQLTRFFCRWVHVAYTVIGLYFLPLRFYQYKKRAWHYFLFDLCYYVTILNFVYFWVFPSSPALFVACYCLSHGSLASAVITWRNSLVFHDQDKVISLFIHIYAPFTFTVIRYVPS